MASHTLDIAPSTRQPSRGTAVLLSVAALVALVFVAGAALPYFLSSSYGPPEYAPRRLWLLLHIGGGIVAIFTGPVQLWLGLNDRSMAWHRRLGIVYMSAVGLGSVAGMYMATHTDFGWVFGAGLGGLAVAWIATSALAYLAIRRSLVDQHKEWMIRSYVVTFAFVIFRVIQPGLQAAGIGTVPEQLATAAWACWAVPLLLTELVLQGRKVLTVRA